MKFTNVIQKLSAVSELTKDNRGNHTFFSKFSSHRSVKVYRTGSEGQNAMALPILIQYNGEEVVAFHANTIKELVAFLSD